MFVLKLGIKFKFLQPSRSYLVWHLPTFPTLSPPNSPPLCLTFIILQSYWPFFCSPEHSKALSAQYLQFMYFLFGIFSPRSCCGWLYFIIQLSVHGSSSQRGLSWSPWLKMLQCCNGWLLFLFFSPCFIFVHKTITS